jgi:hypothetical protein
MKEKQRLALRPGNVIKHKKISDGGKKILTEGRVRDYDEKVKDKLPSYVAVQTETQGIGVHNAFWLTENVELVN